ncbi:MAG: 3-deoxy-manno-octulosonate cytidylyltransferase [Pseudomonadota bacterium]
MTEVDFKIVVPARYQSTRFPGKPLALIDGVPMIVRVYQRVAGCAAEVVVATDDHRIAQVCRKAGAEVCMTSADHETGTDRIAEVSEQRGWADECVVVNVQGDEPLIPLSSVRQVAANLHRVDDASISTLCTPIERNDEASDPSNVKVVFDHLGMALYFSRMLIPHDRDATAGLRCVYRHLGLYAYRAGFLKRFPSLPPCDIESLEKLEQLRALWNGERIHVDIATELPGPGVDTPEQLAEVEALFRQQQGS